MTLRSEVKILRNVYFFVFFLGVVLVVLMHIFERPAFDLFRVPSFIEEASQFNNLDYLTTFRIYQYTLVFSLLNILLDALCLTRYKSRVLVKISQYATFLGALLIVVALTYFVYNLFIVEGSIRLTAWLYTLFAVFLVALDVLTFRADRSLGAK